MEFLLPHLLINSAARYPDNEAVRMDGQAITYAELDVLTDKVAATLQSMGVKRGDRVGVYVHKSPASVISVFGIMKAGAAYVPLDPNAPVKRLAYITRDCGIQVMLTSCAKAASLTEFQQEGSPLTQIILTDSPETNPEIPEGIEAVSWATVTGRDISGFTMPEAIEADLAYILYTSGSTGVPKGVMIAHRTIFTFVNWCCDEFKMTPDDRVTSHAPLHFDLSTFDLYATIKAGATIVPVAEHLSALPVQLADLLQKERITITYLVPSILSFMASYGKLDAHDFSALRTILFAGEVFPLKYLRKLMAAVPHVSYYNLYGPTETNVCTYYRVQPEDVAPDRTQPVPIGRACANVEVFAVNDAGGLVTEPGQEGELWARGSCVAQGYWGDRSKTDAAFVQNPFNTLYPDIAYRTGDIVTLAPDLKNWLYAGRRDHMIKSRGYRIELGEIENALHQHENVKEAAVVAVPDELLGSRIRAFVVQTDGGSVTSKELEAWCARRVPKYMVPENIEFCDALPKTSSGKTDRPALLARINARKSLAGASSTPA
ncbi:MAG TPA: amino acid adenylation domain-containing protein [Verrucomicrobiales bacterium]|nr:amino acid adenylation domain-containing protein [Verrucomicrobiales bacterium]